MRLSDEWTPSSEGSSRLARPWQRGDDEGSRVRAKEVAREQRSELVYPDAGSAASIKRTEDASLLDPAEHGADHGLVANGQEGLAEVVLAGQGEQSVVANKERQLRCKPTERATTTTKVRTLSHGLRG